ncbi:MAG TPA: hypothetical protein VNJ08_15405 [Bacteriovoracaceae bacterium]|nr:hypothetical protein [Bacteriovoracaceae bacterium]
MKLSGLALFLFFISTGLKAQEQLAVRLNEQGILKIMEMALKYNTATEEKRTFVIPQNLYKFTIPKSQLIRNPVVRVVNEISNLNMNRNLDFYLHTSDISITGDVDKKSLRTTIFNSHDNGFDVKLSIELPKITVKGAKLSLCETKKNAKECGGGLKASLINVNVVTKDAPIKLEAVIRLSTFDNQARVTVVSVVSNLEGKDAPKLVINFESVSIPKVSLVINGHANTLDTSGLKAEIYKRKVFLGAKLLAFVADFITADLAEMINVYLMNKQVATSWQLLNQGYSYPGLVRLSQDPMAAMMGQIADILSHAQVELSLRKISTPGNKDIELAGMLNFILNNRVITVNDSLGNNDRNKLPKLNLNSERYNDINLALSEPLINGALDLVNTTGLYQDVFDGLAKVPGFSIKSVKVHFSTRSNMYAVVNTSVDLKKLQSSGVKSWLKNKIAAFLERNNNDAVIYFPIQVEFFPFITRLNNGAAGLDLYVKSPFENDTLLNYFNYPSNVGDMYDSVRKGVMAELKSALSVHTSKRYEVNLSKFLNQAGVEFLPRMISVNQGAYLMINLDLIDIKFNSKKPFQNQGHQ